MKPLSPATASSLLRRNLATSSRSRARRVKSPATVRVKSPAPGSSLAVLIDGDNVNLACLPWLLQHIERRGRVCLVRYYGNFYQADFKITPGALLSKYNVQFRRSPTEQVSKNATDMIMTVDAMDLLHADRYSAFYLITGDSDFRPLASRIREQGSSVHGYGWLGTISRDFKAVCDTYTALDDIDPSACREEIHDPHDEPLVSKALSVPSQQSYTIANPASSTTSAESMLSNGVIRNVLSKPEVDLPEDIPAISANTASTSAGTHAAVTSSSSRLISRSNKFELYTKHGKEVIRTVTGTRLWNQAYRGLPSTELETAVQPIDEAALSAIRSTLAHLGVSETNFVRISDVANYLRAHYPMVRREDFGYRQFLSFLDASDLVRIGWIDLNGIRDTWLVGLPVKPSVASISHTTSAPHADITSNICSQSDQGSTISGNVLSAELVEPNSASQSTAQPAPILPLSSDLLVQSRAHSDNAETRSGDRHIDDTQTVPLEEGGVHTLTALQPQMSESPQLEDSIGEVEALELEHDRAIDRKDETVQASHSSQS